MKKPHFWPGLPLLLVAVLALILPLIPADIDSLRWHGLKTLVFEVGTAVLLSLWQIFGASAPGEHRYWKGTPLFLALLVLWAWLSHALTPVSAPDHAFSFCGFWLLMGGGVVMSVVARGTQPRAGLSFLLGGLVLAVIVISSAAVALYQQAGIPVAEGTYHDHELLAAALMVLLPFSLAALTSPLSPGRKIMAMLAFTLCSAALLLSQTRSSWIGAAVALLVFGMLVLWRRLHAPWQRIGSGERQRRRFQGIVYAILVLSALGFFVAYSQQSGRISGRAQTLTTSVLQGKEASVEWRFAVWRGAAKMIEERPLLGWGIGCYPLHHDLYTQGGKPQPLLAANGPRIGDEAHNSYLQIAAELGIPGLLLWLAMLGTAFAGGVGALKRLPEGGLRQRVLIGALASLAGQSVDALANPAWQFGEISIYFWIVLGVIVGRTVDTAREAERSEVPSVARRQIWMRPFQMAVVILWCLWAAAQAIINARVLPTPHL